MAITPVLNRPAKLLKRWIRDTHARLLVGVAISLVLGWLSVRGMEWGLVVDQFQDFPMVWAIASLTIIIVAAIFRAYRWQVLFVRQKIPLMSLFMVQNAGLGLNSLMPIRVVAEGAQFALLTVRYRVKGGTALGTLGVERILDLVVTASLLMAGLTLLPSKGDFIPYVAGAFVVAVAAVLAVPFLIWLSRKPVLNRISLLVSTTAYLRDLTKKKVTLSYALLMTLVHWLLVGICAWVLAFGMGVEVTLFEATLVILGTLFFATALPALPAAAGTFEFGVVYVLKAFGVPQALAFSYGVVIHAVLFLPPIIIAIVVFSSIGLRPVKQGGPVRPVEEDVTLSVEDQKRGAR